MYEQREYIWKALNSIPGISAVKPKAAFYIFPRIETEKFRIGSDAQMALDLLKRKHILVTPGSGFNWGAQDHFRIVYLPNMEELHTAMDRMSEFFGSYIQGKD